MEQSLAMGGYAGYLLAAYGVTAVVVIGNLIAARRRFRRTHKRLREQLTRRAGRTLAPGLVGDPVGQQSSSSATVGRRS